MGFKALGLEACPVANAEEARETLRRLTKDSEDYAIIYVEENLAQELQHEIDKFKDVPLPAIILMLSFVGFAAFTAEAGIPVEQVMFMTGMIWALPAATAASAMACSPKQTPSILFEGA